MNIGQGKHTWVQNLILFAELCAMYPTLRFAAGRYEQGFGFSEFMKHVRTFGTYLAANREERPYWQQPFIFSGAEAQQVKASPKIEDHPAFDLWMKTFDDRYREAVAQDEKVQAANDAHQEEFEALFSASMQISPQRPVAQRQVGARPKVPPQDPQNDHPSPTPADTLSDII